MKETCADWVGPRSVSLLCLCGKAEGHNWATVLFRVSIGDDFYLPVKGRGLKGMEMNKVNTADRLQYQCIANLNGDDEHWTAMCSPELVQDKWRR